MSSEPTETSPLLIARDSERLCEPAFYEALGIAGRRGSESVDEESQAGITSGETHPHQPPTSANQEPPSPQGTPKFGSVIPVLLIGVFVANADTSLVLATNETISSDFNDLENAGWLLTSYGLAGCAVQPLYGKLSDIYGRKTILIICYLIFAIGCAVCGAGPTIWLVVLGRAISGIGGAGMTSLVSIIITDLVPMRDIASWRSYVNISATTGRSLGGVIGGSLADTIGWRWSFYGQSPLTLLAAILVLWRLPSTHSNSDFAESHRVKFQRIDLLGAAFLTTAIICFMLVLDLGGSKLPWNSPLVLVFLGLSIALGILFVLVEAYQAKEPIFPIRLMLHRDVLTSYLICGLQVAAQIGIMFSVPLFFQVSNNSSTTNAGAHLIPAVVGNAIGMLVSGYVIKKTGHYKLLTLLGALASCVSYLTLALRWHGHVSFLESLEIFPGGFGTGVMLSTTFIGLTAGIEPADMAVAGTGLYQAQNIGAVLGLSLVEAVLQGTLRPQLERGLGGFKHKTRIVERSIEDFEFVKRLTGRARDLVVNSYVRSLMYTHITSLALVAPTIFITLLSREHKL